MGYLNESSCYLVGPVEHVSDFGADWREVLNNKLVEMGVKVYNPLNRPYWMESINQYVPPTHSRQEILEKIHDPNSDPIWIKAQKFVRDICLRYVSTCDFIFCYLPSSKTYGSVEELALANKSGKPIITVCPDDFPSLWMFDILDYDTTFRNFDDALNYLNNINDGKIELDALKWIFIDDKYSLKSME